MSLSDHTREPDHPQPTDADRPVPIAILLWLLPSILMSFAIPGFLIIQMGLARDGSLVLTPARLEQLQNIGAYLLLGSCSARLALWPPHRLQAFLERYLDSEDA